MRVVNEFRAPESRGSTVITSKQKASLKIRVTETALNSRICGVKIQAVISKLSKLAQLPNQHQFAKFLLATLDARAVVIITSQAGKDVITPCT
jgi:hypothetical protein